MQVDRLSQTFRALADPTRRALLARLAAGEASVTELATPFQMTVRAVSKHIGVLQRAGLVSRTQDSQRRPSRIELSPLAEVDDWLGPYRAIWEQRFDNIERTLEALSSRGRHGPRK